MNPTYSEFFSRAWNDMKDNLAFVAALSAVTIVGCWGFSLIPFIGSFFAGLISTGYLYCLYRMKKGHVIGYKDFFWAFVDFNRLIKILILNSIVGLIAIVAYICLIIPGIWWTVATIFAGTIFAIKNEDPMAAIKASMNIVKDRWWYFFGMGGLVVLANIAGALCLVIGVLVSMPLTAYVLIEVVEQFYHPAAVPAGEQQMDIAQTTSAEPPPIA